LWLTAAENPPDDSRTAVTLAVIGLLSALGVALVGGLFSWLIARQNKAAKAADPQPATPVAVMDLSFRDYLVGELAKGEQRDDNNDGRDDTQDRLIFSNVRRIDQIEWYLDLTNPEWRHGPR
jgi:hypothetical protein